MSCYHPMLGVPDYESLSENGKRIYKILPYSIYDPLDRSLYPGAISIPCGKCIGCRLDYSRSWADRMMLELDHTKKGVFFTLTYDNDHVPLTCDDDGQFGWFTLEKSDLQKFFKRLRKRFKDKEIRFYAAGEYGSNTQRPHYHAIVFGLSLDDFPDRSLQGKNELGQCHYRSDLLQGIWKQGFCVLSDVSWKTCAYVARYVTKKVLSSDGFLEYTYGCAPEFSLMSRRPGLGAYYMFDHPDMFANSNIYVSGHDQPISIPKYHLKKLELIDKDLYDKIIQERSVYARDRELKKLINTDLSYVEQLEVEENKKLARTSALKRL